MYEKVVKFYLMSAGAVLLLSGLAKYISAFGNARILDTADPVFKISFGVLFWVVGTIELGIGLRCFVRKKPGQSLWLVGALATCFLFYRIARARSGYHRPCPCFGNLTDALHMSPLAADKLTLVAFLYLFVGSYVALCSIYFHKKSHSIEAALPVVK